MGIEAVAALKGVTDNAFLELMQSSESIGLGIDAILTGLASDILSNKLSASDIPQVELINLTLDSVAGAFQNYWATSPITPRRTMQFAEEQVVLKDLAREYLKRFFLDELNLPELLKDTSVVIIAGHQGSGKDSLAPVLAELGFVGASMSIAVQNVAFAWGYEQTSTVDKITVGKKLKELLGSGILVPITIARMAARGDKKIAMFGPRVMGEAEAVCDLHGILVGIAARSDYKEDREIRRERIKARAVNDPNRADDVMKFDQREEIEAPGIINIMSLPQCHCLIDDSPLEVFREHFRDFISPLLI